MSKLIIPTLKTFLIGVIALGILLFLPAWTFAYWQAWIFIVVFMLATNAIGIYLSLKDPVLLERRKKVGPAEEGSIVQKIIASLLILGALSVVVFSAFDHRFAWSSMPASVSWVGDALVVLGLLINFFVLKENSYSSSTIQVVEEQKVISTGLYARVRHPMYVGALIMIIGVPLALGSWWGLVALVILMPVLIWRILDEEKVLKEGLSGYREYTQKVRYRLVPYIW